MAILQWTSLQYRDSTFFCNKGHFSPPRKDEDKRKFDKRKENICETTITLKSFDLKKNNLTIEFESIKETMKAITESLLIHNKMY